MLPDSGSHRRSSRPLAQGDLDVNPSAAPALVRLRWFAFGDHEVVESDEVHLD
jgi:hypothetical protein